MAALVKLLRPSLLANQYPALHGLRVLGIVSIIQIHLGFEAGARGLLPQDSALYGATQRLWFGMDLFFVLSGFLIGNLLLASAEPGGGGVSIGRFYLRRSFRIVPLYYVVLTLFALTSPPDPLKSAQLWREYAYLTNYSDVAHVVMFWGWSLCVEEHFYLAVPLVMLALGRLSSHRARLGVLFALFAGCGALRVGLALSHPEWDAATFFARVYIPTHTRFDTLVAGIAIAYVTRTWGEALAEAFALPLVRRATLAVAFASFFSLLVWSPLPPKLWAPLSLGTVTSIGWAATILHLLYAPSWASRALGARPFLWLATLGYGVYLVHMPLVVLVGLGAFAGFGALLPRPLAFALAVLVVFAFALGYAYVLHLAVEKPALWVRDRLAPAKPGPRR